MDMRQSLVAWAGRLATGCALLLMSSASLQAATVESMRLWAAPDHARLVFDLSAAAQANVFTLDNPARLVIDLDDSQLDTDVSTLPWRVALSLRCVRARAMAAACGWCWNSTVISLHAISPCRPTISTVTGWWWIWSTPVKAPSKTPSTPSRR